MKSMIFVVFYAFSRYVRFRFAPSALNTGLSPIFIADLSPTVGDKFVLSGSKASSKMRLERKHFSEYYALIIPHPRRNFNHMTGISARNRLLFRLRICA
ncbi:MAG: hypothetical protein K6G29_03800 [Clostridiales bacterium]|nr:hypothetical protein [Clostridiales bacterium]